MSLKVEERSRERSESARFDDALLLALEGATSQGMWAPLEAAKGQGLDSPLEPPEGPQP